MATAAEGSAEVDAPFDLGSYDPSDPAEDRREDEPPEPSEDRGEGQQYAGQQTDR